MTEIVLSKQKKPDYSYLPLYLVGVTAHVVKIQHLAETHTEHSYKHSYRT